LNEHVYILKMGFCVMSENVVLGEDSFVLFLPLLPTCCAMNWCTLAFDWTISKKFAASLLPGPQNFTMVDVISDMYELIP